ncbi:MAG TPA: hypothetical protein VMM76_10070 [Pirellulaceae bacterium]|nr:hypothetical protein [Pirellulaceae bacterium]
MSNSSVGSALLGIFFCGLGGFVGCTPGSNPEPTATPASQANAAPQSSTAPVAATPPADAQATPASLSASVGGTAPDKGAVPGWAGQPGEPFDVKQYFASREPPPDNAAPLYLSALAQISGELGDERAKALGASIGKLADIDKLQSGAIQPQQVEQVLNDAAEAVKQLDLAQSKSGCVFLTGYSIDTLLPHVQAAREVARLSSLQLFHAREKQDFAIAEGAVRRCLHLSRDLQPRGFLVCQLVSIAMDTVVLTGIERVTLNDPQLTALQCDQLLSLLIEHEQRGLDRHQESIRTEYIFARNTIDDLKSGRRTFADFLELIGPSTPKQNEPAIEPTLNYDAEIAACNRLFALAIKESQVPFAQVAVKSAFRDEVDRVQAAAKTAALTARQTGKTEAPLLMLFLVPGINAVREATTRSAANLAGIQALIALRRYELTHGHFPTTLAEATAESILQQKVLDDPYSGQPMRYAILGGKPTVYSVGKDLKDDGGEADWKHGQQPGDYLFVLAPRPGSSLTPPKAVAAPPKPAEPMAAENAKLESRVWTSSVGTKIEATFMRLEGEVVVLKKKDDSLLRVPLTKLIASDQQWIRESRR